MTRKFLDILFRGKWDLYGHFTANFIFVVIAFPFVGCYAVSGWFLFLGKEFYDWHKYGYFNWWDVVYNTYGATLAFLFTILI